MLKLLGTLLATAASALKPRRELALENLALRQQLAAFTAKKKRPVVTESDRLFWVALSQVWSGWAEALVIVKPETVVRWHREGFRRYWRRKSRPKKPGRPRVDPEVRKLIVTMSQANPTWGAPRIHGELLKLKIEVSDRTVGRLMPRRRKPPSQTWRAFLDNHVEDIVAIDLCVVPSATFRVLYLLVVLAHDRRRVVHCNVTEHPTAEWTARQIVQAFPWEEAPRYLLRDRDSIYGDYFSGRVAGMGIDEVLSAPRSPWQNPYCERFMGSLRRECLDHVIILGDDHLRRIVRSYLEYYHGSRTHLSLEKDPPTPRDVQPPEMGKVIALPQVGGLHHRYERQAA